MVSTHFNVHIQSKLHKYTQIDMYIGVSIITRREELHKFWGAIKTVGTIRSFIKQNIIIFMTVRLFSWVWKCEKEQWMQSIFSALPFSLNSSRKEFGRERKWSWKHCWKWSVECNTELSHIFHYNTDMCITHVVGSNNLGIHIPIYILNLSIWCVK